MPEFPKRMREIAQSTKDATGAANDWAGTKGMELLGALNAKAGTRGLGLNAVVRLLTGESGEATGALNRWSGPVEGEAVVNVPGAPGSFSASAGDAQVSLAWAGPSNTGGGPIVSYTITVSPGGATYSTTQTSYVLTGLANSASYTFTVAAVNKAGTGASTSATATPVAPAPVLTAPGIPTGLSATPGNAQVSLSWTAPASNGGSVITGYRITSTPGGATSDVIGTFTTLTGLTNATAYTFSVAALNAVGVGPAASTSATPTAPATVPGAPTSVSGAPGDARVTVSFLAPVSDGGSPITSYTVTSSPSSFTASGSSSPIAVTGMSNGASYTFTVKATNAVGTGPASTASALVTPFGTPGAPRSVTGVPGDGQVALSWGTPTNNGGSAITDYQITVSPGGTSVLTGSAATSYIMTGLTNDTAYTFVVRAVNAAGLGGFSVASAAVTPSATAGAAIPVSAYPSANQVAYFDARYVNGFGGANPAANVQLATWTDLSPAGRNATHATSSKWPTMKTTLVNGVATPTVYFSGAQQLDTAAFAMNKPGTIYAVAIFDNVTTDSLKRNVWSHRGTTTDLMDLFRATAGNGGYWASSLTVGGTPSNVLAPDNTAVAQGTKYAMTTVVTASNAQLFRNGVGGTVVSQTWTTFANAPLRLGAGGSTASPNFYWLGHICALLVYNVAHDTTTRQTIERQLATDWGFTVA